MMPQGKLFALPVDVGEKLFFIGGNVHRAISKDNFIK